MAKSGNALSHCLPINDWQVKVGTPKNELSCARPALLEETVKRLDDNICEE